MKRFYTLLLGAALPLLGWSQTAPLPYQSLLYQDADWTVEDLGSSSKWEDDSSAGDFTTDFAGSSPVGKKYKWDSSNPADDWLISPAFHLEAGKEYKVKYYMTVASASYEEKCALWYGTASTAQGLKDTGLQIGLETKKGFRGYISYTVTPAATADYHFGIQACSDKDKMNLCVSHFQLRENIFAPGAPTDLEVTPGADRAMEATLTWSWPEKDVDGADLPAGATRDKVVITRNGQTVATLTGDVSSWKDTAEAGLTSGKHTYGVTCWVNGAASPEAKVASKYIGPVSALALPYKLTESSQEDFQTFWTITKGPGSGSTNKPTYSNSYTKYISSSTGSRTVDEWLIGPELKFAKAGVYRVTLEYNFSQSDKSIDMYMGRGTSPDAYTDLVKSFTATSRATEYVILTITEPCEKALAFHLTTEGTASVSTIYFYEYNVEEWHLSPDNVTDLKAEVTGPDKVTLSWTNPSTDNTGAAITALSKVEIYRNDALVKTLTEGIAPGAASQYVDTPDGGGTFKYKAVPYIGDTAPDTKAPEVTSAWVGDETQALPFNSYFYSSDQTAALWKVVDLDPDNGLTWSTPAPGAAPELAKPASGKSTYADYLVSPLLDFPSAGTYKISLNLAGGKTTSEMYPGFQLEVGLVSDKSSDAAMVSSFVSTGKYFESDSKNSWGIYPEAYIEVPAAGKYAVAFFTPAKNRAGQDNDLYSSDKNLKLSSFKVNEFPVYPAAPSDLTATGAADGSSKAVLTWTNPTATTADVDGITLSLVKAVISRKPSAAAASDWEEIHTITEGLVPGGEMTWTDATLPAGGTYSYRVTMHGLKGADAGGKSSATVESGYIGTAPKLEIDTESGANGFQADGWKPYTYKSSTATTVWETTSTMAYVTSRSTNTDEWIFSPYYLLEAGKDYYIDLTSYTDDPGTLLQVWHGDKQTPSGCATKICDLTMNGGRTSAEWQHDKFILRATAADAPAAQADGDLPVYTVPAGNGVLAFRLYYSNGSIYKGGSVTLRNIRATEYIAVSAVTISAAEGAKDITLGGTLALTATVAPDNATLKDVTWASAAPDIATVDEQGVVTGVALGEAKITATSGSITGEYTVTVKPVLASAVTLDATEKEVYPGDEFTLTATVSPDDVTDPTVTWTSSDEAVATVDATGKVTAVAPGEATVTAACGEAKATCAVTVKPVLAESVTLDRTEISATEGTTVQLTATVTPDNVTDKTVTWTSSDESVATVDATGLVSVLKPGEATITASCGEAKATCLVKAVSGIAGILTDDAASIEVYTLGGVRIGDTLNLQSGFYIIRYSKAGTTVTEKIRIK